MQIWAYDIWDGDKGIVLANNGSEACVLIKKKYGEEQLIEGLDVDYYDSKICELHLVVNDNEIEPKVVILAD